MKFRIKDWLYDHKGLIMAIMIFLIAIANVWLVVGMLVSVRNNDARIAVVCLMFLITEYFAMYGMMSNL